MAITYIELIGQLYPNVQCQISGDPDVYANIIWQGGDALPSQAQLDADKITVAKIDRIKQLSSDCATDIVSGFVSDALGADYIYDSEEVDQLNLIGASMAIAPNSATNSPAGEIYYACRDVATQTKAYVLHTYAQLRQVLADGSQVKLGKLQKFAVKRYYVEQASTMEEIEAITWTSTP